ncbi:hypothetical protein [uncultured Metabacillus sp.]|uniref:hypothetical protein n=1 Tax=uncultured Metabacillus sp. TaxID=2860135 RepID=UPI0026383169|nr:hypothetical protein [uncultured Metabacillus sp.]
MKKYFVRCCSQHNQNITLKIEAESKNAAKEIAFNIHKVKQVFNISEEVKSKGFEWRRGHSSPHVINRDGKCITVFC